MNLEATDCKSAMLFQKKIPRSYRQYSLFTPSQ